MPRQFKAMIRRAKYQLKVVHDMAALRPVYAQAVK